MRIGTKITVISCLVAVIAAIMLAVVTTVVFMSFVGTLQEEETNTGVNVLSSEIRSDIEEMGDVAELLIASSWGQINNSDYDSTWASNKPSEASFAAYINGDQAVWSTENFPLSDDAIARVKAGGMKGVMADGDKLYSVYCRPVENGALVVGTDLNDPTYVDDVKEKPVRSLPYSAATPVTAPLSWTAPEYAAQAPRWTAASGTWFRTAAHISVKRR